MPESTPERTPEPIPTVRSPAWLLSGMTGSVAGELQLTQGRLIFDTIDGRRMLDAAVDELTDVSFPWFYFGGGMKVHVGNERYRLSFTRPGNLPDYPVDHIEAGDIRSGRQLGAMWKSALHSTRTR